MRTPQDLFTNVPDNGRVWIIPTDRPLNEDQKAAVLSHLADFFENWQSHGRNVEAESAILADRFIVVSAFIPGSEVSGCGIDASVHALDEIAGKVGFNRAPVLDIFFEENGHVQSVDRQTFAQLAERRDISPDTTVFDTSISSAGDWKKGLFSRPVSESWHAGVFF